ncbi:MAG: hypothetical protein R6U98_06645 [Pirellulaceae bacterium]
MLTDIRRFPEFAERFLRIRPDEGGSTIPFRMNPVQRYLHENYVVPTYRAGKPVRLLILKCRQSGVSTWAESLSYWLAIGHQEWASLVIGEDEEQTRTIFRMIRRYNDYAPWNSTEEDTSLFPLFPQRGDSQRALEFGQKSKVHKGNLYAGRDDVVFLDSTIEVKSAQKEGALGRAGTYQSVHASEAARWPKLTESLSALLSCAHPLPETVTIIECTAYGMNEFYTFWNNLVVGNEQVPTMWQRVFIPWYWDARYELPLEIDREYVSEYEEQLVDRIQSDRELEEIDAGAKTLNRIWAKLFWRRRQIRDVFFGDPSDPQSWDVFNQEFPSTPSEAFLFSGRYAFSPYAMKLMEGHARAPIWRADIDMKRRSGQHRDVAPSIVDVSKHDHGKLRVFEEPQEDAKYVVFGDVAEGKAIEGVAEKLSKWDFSCAQVVKIGESFPLKQVAIWHGNADPDQYGDVLVALARYYNEALLGWEINGPGHALKLQILDIHDYENIYLRKEEDSLSGKILMKAGWRTTRRSKPDMVSIAQKLVRERDLVVYDDATISEMKSFAIMGENKYEAAQGHDDRVIALCGSVAIVNDDIQELRAQIAIERKERERRKREEDRDKMSDHEEEERPWNPILGDEW